MGRMTNEDRARAAYFRRLGSDADIPSVSVDEMEGTVELYNVNGVLAGCTITPKGLRWDEKLPKKSQREWNHMRSTHRLDSFTAFLIGSKNNGTGRAEP